MPSELHAHPRPLTRTPSAEAAHPRAHQRGLRHFQRLIEETIRAGETLHEERRVDARAAVRAVALLWAAHDEVESALDGTALIHSDCTDVPRAH